ncbi:MAG: hypothetical protein JNL67_05165 [Planctomycetaceae bacterium]|nr:hypothetical protein [Planctomycetaceae bacterium]
MTVGLGMMVYGSGQTYNVIAPGPLSSPHAERLAHHGNDRCASCHPQAHQSLGQWIGGMFGNDSSGQKTTQTDLCLNCHQRDMSPGHGLYAHNVTPNELAARTEEVERATSTTSSAIRQVSGAMLVGLPFKNGQPIACATCHREHHGQEIDMKAMTNQQCQSCHGQTFHSFELDHPEFKNWPTIAPQGIRFDHSTHHFKHFPQGNRPFECAQCHRDDKQGNVQLLVGFEQACGSCHQGPIDLSAERGLALLRIPSLDVRSLQEAQQAVGQWPEALSQGFDGRLSPFSELLLRADKDAAAGLDVLGVGFDFLDLDPADRTQAQAATQIAWGIKRLVADLALRGNEAIRQRLQIALQESIDDARLARLTQNFSPTLAQDSGRLWFPQLWNEVKAEQVSPVAVLDSDLQASSNLMEAGSSRLVIPRDLLAKIMESESQTQDRSQELLLENPLANAYGASGTPTSPSSNVGPQGSANQVAKPTTPSRSTSQPPLSQSPTSPPSSAGSSSAAVSRDVGGQSPRTPNGASQATTVGPANDDPNLLASNPLANYGSGAPAAAIRDLPEPSSTNNVTPRDQDPPVASSRPDAVTALAPESGGITTETQTNPAENLPRNTAKHKLVGWVRNETSFSMDYHLQGHADLLLKEWIDLLIQGQSSGKAPEWVTYALGEIAAPDKPGNCLQCHGDQSGAAVTASANWNGKYRDPALKGWTKFNHRPHTLLPGLSDCRSCHQLRETPAGQGGAAVEIAKTGGQALQVTSVGFTKSVLGANSAQESELQQLHAGHRSDFHSLTKSQCASCHQAGSTSNSCTTCHNYHIGQRVQQ